MKPFQLPDLELISYSFIWERWLSPLTAFPRPNLPHHTGEKNQSAVTLIQEGERIRQFLIARCCPKDTRQARERDGEMAGWRDEGREGGKEWGVLPQAVGPVCHVMSQCPVELCRQREAASQKKWGTVQRTPHWHTACPPPVSRNAAAHCLWQGHCKIWLWKYWICTAIGLFTNNFSRRSFSFMKNMVKMIFQPVLMKDKWTINWI